MARKGWLLPPGSKVAHFLRVTSNGCYFACWTPFWTAEQEEKKINEAVPAKPNTPRCKRCERRAGRASS